MRERRTEALAGKININLFHRIAAGHSLLGMIPGSLKNLPSLIEEARIKISVIIEKEIAANDKRLPHLSSSCKEQDHKHL